jgi:prevent-host-death family protein
MKAMSARDAKNGFGLLVDTARAEPVLVQKHGFGVVVVISVEEYERLSARSGRYFDTVAPAGLRNVRGRHHDFPRSAKG